MRPLIDIIYEQTQNKFFCKKLESIQYKDTLATTGARQGTSRERRYKRLSCMFKIMNDEAPNYLLNLIPKSQQTITTRNNHIPNYHCRTDCFKHSFFPSTLKNRFNLNGSVRNSESLAIFKSRLLSFIRPIQSNVHNIYDPIGLKLLTRLRLGWSHLNEHKLRHNFQDCLNPLCSCSLEIEDTIHYFANCHHFSQYRFYLKNNIKSVSDDFESF